MRKLLSDTDGMTSASPQFTGAEASPRLRVSTRSLRQRDRFEVYRENFRQHLFQVDVTNRAEGAFDGNIELLKAGSVGVSRVAAQPTVYTRARNHVSNSDDGLTLFVGRTHGPVNEQAGIVHEFRPGNGFLYHDALPGGCEALSPFEVWAIKVPADRLKSGLVRGRDPKPMRIPSELPAMQLLVQYLNSFATVAGSRDPNVHEAFGTHLVDLLTLIIGADRNSLELIKGRGLKAARTEAVLTAIGRDFASPDLSAERVGLLLGITARQVHRLLDETAKTFYEHVLERRLIESHRLLTDPGSAALNVADVAARVGFVDRSHFHRLFRTRFGDTPTGVRAVATREHTARLL
jgi:AraC-like DNA-binding protein